MGRANFAEEASTPDTPSSGHVTLYFLSSGSGIPVTRDDAGTIRTVALNNVANAFTAIQTVTISDTSAIPTDANLPGDSSPVQMVNSSDAAVYAGIGLNARTTASARALLGLEWQSSYNGDLFLRMRTGASTSAEIFRVTSSGGDMGIGTNSPSAKLHVDQDDTAGARPALYLDQADVSEEMMQFETTIGTGNAIEAVGAKALTTTHFVKVTLPGGLTRYFPVGTIA